MSNLSWWRSWHGAPTDLKWQVISSRCGVKTGIVSAIVWALLDYASQQKERGSIEGFDTEMYSIYSGFEENEISKNAFGGTELAKRKLASIIDPELLKEFQIISSRHRDFNPEKIRIFWAHDLPEDPESAKFKDKSIAIRIANIIKVEE